MHEMSIAESLFEIIGEQIQKNSLTRVTVIRMRIGEMSGVVPDALEFAFEVLARGTPVEGARLEVTRIPMQGRCDECTREFPVENYFFECPGCGSGKVRVTAGEELSLDELEGE
jgi:hydrogenase nickel incorporation protein HypA/HybF